MKPYQKVAWVLGGYLACFLLAYGIAAVYVAHTAGPDRQTSGGMYAFGDAMLFLGLFGVSSLVPTAIALCFLRPYRRFWTVLSGVSLAFAALAIGAVVLFYVGRGDPKTARGMWVAYSVLVILATPLLSLAFAVCAVFSPHRSARIAFIASTFAEAAVFLAWFLPRFFLPY
jgi:hypothetical protein